MLNEILHKLVPGVNKNKVRGGRSTTGVQNDNDTITQRLFNAFICNVVYVMKLDDHAGRSKH